MKRRHSIFIGASILAIGGFLAKILGAFYKIPLTHILGANGMGIYYLVFPFYSLCLILASSGISLAVTRLVAIERKKYNKRNELKILLCALMVSSLISLILVGVTILIAKPFSFMQGNTNSYLGYFAIAPAIFFASIVGVFKGYFQGIENMFPSSISLIISQGTRLLFGLLLAYIFMSYGIMYSVLGAILGVTISELFSMIYLFVRFAIYRKGQFYKFYERRKDNVMQKVRIKKCKFVELGSKKAKVYRAGIKKYQKSENIKNIYYFKDLDLKSKKEIFRQIIRYSIPSTLSNLIVPLCVFSDSFLVVNLLTKSGFSTSVATSMYGMSNGIVSSLISLPLIIISSISTSIVPNLSSSIEINSRETVVSKTNFFIKFAWIIALPMAVLFILFSPEIIEILYAGGLSSKVIDEFSYSYRILAVASISIVYNAFLYTFQAVLNAFGKPQAPFYSQCVGLLFRVALTFILVSIPSINVFGVLIANIVFLSISCIGCVIALRKLIPLRMNIRRFFVMPVLSMSLTGVLGYTLKKFVPFTLSPIIKVGLIGGIMVIIYVVLLVLLKTFTIKEWSYFPIPKKLLKFLPKKVKSSLTKEEV